MACHWRKEPGRGKFKKGQAGESERAFHFWDPPIPDSEEMFSSDQQKRRTGLELGKPVSGNAAGGTREEGD